MLNWWLILLAIIICLLIIGLSIYILILYLSEEDKKGSWAVKVIIVLGFTLVSGAVLLLPFDVAGRPNLASGSSSAVALKDYYKANKDTMIMWEAVLWVLSLFAIAVVPFATFYYEAYDPDKTGLYQVVKALILTVIILVFVFLLAIILWVTVGSANIPYTKYIVSIQYVSIYHKSDNPNNDGNSTHNITRIINNNSVDNNTNVSNTKFDDRNIYNNSNINSNIINNINRDISMEMSDDISSLKFNQETLSKKYSIKVSFFVYLIAVICFIGWIFFMVFGGVGLFAFPIDLIIGFIYRQKPISGLQFTKETDAVANKASSVLAEADELYKGITQGYVDLDIGTKKKINELKNETYLLENQLEELIYSYEKAGGSPFVVFGKLFLGIICLAISVAWFLHVIIHNAANFHPFLNSMLISMDNFFSLFGVVFYGFFTFYLLWATFVGQIRLGLRLLLFTIHPLRVGDTPLNSILFNLAILLFISIAVIQFCTMSFADYATNTSISSLMNVHVRYLKGIGSVIPYFQYVFLGIAFISVFFILICPRKGEKRLFKSKNVSK